MQSNNMRKIIKKGFILIILFITILSTELTYANSEQPGTTDTTKRKRSGPYCGVNCIYTIMKLAGMEIDFRDLLKPYYLGSRKGSSLAELKQVAEDYGLHAKAVEKLTNQILVQSEYPIILHVKSDPMSKEYDHYILFLGIENGFVKVIDPPHPSKLISFAELSLLWDSTGLIVSADPIELSSILASSRKQFILYGVIAIAIILALHWSKRFFPKSLLNSRIKFMGMSIAQVAGFTTAAVFIGMFYHFVNETGFLSNANAMITIQKAHQGNFIPKITEKKVEELLGTNTVFIDARLSRDYEAGHLEGAISIPVDSNDVERLDFTKDIAKNARIVMYCQSSGCQYAEIVAIKLQEDGFRNISIYKGGWRDWTAKNIKEEKS